MQATSLFYSLRTHALFDKLVLACGVTFISFSSVFVHLISAGPATIGAYRMAIGGLILLLFTFITKKSIVITKRFIFPAMIAGLFFCLDLATWHQSIHYVGPGLATILNSCQIFLLAFHQLVFSKRKNPQTPDYCINLYYSRWFITLFK
ncbi:EamA family transporter [Piscirickettsia litoralis]|uniref:EamA family transporter n=1 Tax=Piscirickettsia litoralis TaxID=1891921 RepID=UPI001F2861B4|nr:EamA family transporter [Piscirickettsia litoralis]